MGTLNPMAPMLFTLGLAGPSKKGAVKKDAKAAMEELDCEAWRRGEYSTAEEGVRRKFEEICGAPTPRVRVPVQLAEPDETVPVEEAATCGDGDERSCKPAESTYVVNVEAAPGTRALVRLAPLVAAEFEKELSKDAARSVVNRAELARVLAEQERSLEDYFAQAPVGQLCPAGKMVEAKMDEIDGMYYLLVKIVDAESGEQNTDYAFYDSTDRLRADAGRLLADVMAGNLRNKTPKMEQRSAYLCLREAITYDVPRPDPQSPETYDATQYFADLNALLFCSDGYAGDDCAPAFNTALATSLAGLYKVPERRGTKFAEYEDYYEEWISGGRYYGGEDFDMERFRTGYLAHFDSEMNSLVERYLIGGLRSKDAEARELAAGTLKRLRIMTEAEYSAVKDVLRYEGNPDVRGAMERLSGFLDEWNSARASLPIQGAPVSDDASEEAEDDSGASDEVYDPPDGYPRYNPTE